MVNKEYIAFRSSKGGYNYYGLRLSSSDPYDHARVRSFDRMLHRALSNIFRERRLTSSQIRKLIRAPTKRTGKNSIFKLILEREPSLGKLLLKRSKLSLLWIAILSCYQDSAELLIRSGADVNEPFGYRWFDFNEHSTLLHALLIMYPSSWNDRCIGLLIDHGADFKVRDRMSGRTVLHLAAEYGRVKAAKMLLEKGADSNASDVHDITPLLEAVQSSKVDELLPLFIKHGADVTVTSGSPNGFCRNALYYLARAPDGEHIDQAKLLIEKGVSARGTDLDQYDAIHVATSKGKIELVKLLLDHGADVNARGHDGETPLIVATHYCKDPAMMLTLLKRGADVNMRTYSGSMALHYFTLLFLNNDQDKVELEKLKLLLAAGADMFADTLDYEEYLSHFDVICHSNMNNVNSLSVRLTLKAMALKKACEQPIESKNERIVNRYPLPRKYYQDCHAQISRSKSAKVIETCTLFDLLTKCQCQIAELVRNPVFQRQFRRCDLSVCSLYADDILENFEGAVRYDAALLELENLINEVSNELVHTTLPYLVVRQVIRYVQLTCEMCELRKIAQVSQAK